MPNYAGRASRQGGYPEDYPNKCHLLILGKLIIGHGIWVIYHVLWEYIRIHSCFQHPKPKKKLTELGRNINKHRPEMYHPASVLLG